MLILLCEEYKCIFVVYSRCWSKTMIQFMKNLYNLDENINHTTITSIHNICLNQCSNEEFENIKDKYYIYFMVRNPYERFLSNVKAHGTFEDKSFIEIINIYKKNDYWYQSFYNIAAEILLRGEKTKILYFDNFEKDLNDILIKHNFPIKIYGKKELNWLDINKTEFKNKNCYELKLSLFTGNKMINYKHFYNQEIIDFIYKKLKDDFIYFGFDKNIGNLVPND